VAKEIGGREAERLGRSGGVVSRGDCSGMEKVGTPRSGWGLV